MRFGLVFLLDGKAVVVRVTGQDIRINENVFQPVVQEPFIGDIPVNGRSGHDIEGFRPPRLDPEVGGNEPHIFLGFLDDGFEFVGSGDFLVDCFRLLDAGGRFHGFFRNTGGKFVLVVQLHEGPGAVSGHPQAQNDAGDHQDLVVVLFFRHGEIVFCELIAVISLQTVPAPWAVRSEPGSEKPGPSLVPCPCRA